MPPFLERLNRRSLYPACWIALSVLMSALDYRLGPFVQFPITFVFPVVLAAWFNGVGFGVALAVALPLVRLYYITLWSVPWGIDYSVVNAVIRIAILSGLAELVDRTARQGRELARRVDVLEGLLPICSGCKKIRDEENRWEAVESYLGRRSGAVFTHGLCPCCAREYFGEDAAGLEDELAA